MRTFVRKMGAFVGGDKGRSHAVPPLLDPGLEPIDPVALYIRREWSTATAPPPHQISQQRMVKLVKEQSGVGIVHSLLTVL